MNKYADPSELVTDVGTSEFPTPTYKLGFLFFRRPYFSDPFFSGILFVTGLLLLSKAIYVRGQGQIDLSSQSIVAGTERALIAFHLSFLLLWILSLPLLSKRARKDKRVISDHETLIADINGVVPKWKMDKQPYFARRGIEFIVLVPFIIAGLLIGTASIESQKITKELNATYLKTYNLNHKWNDQVKPVTNLVTHLSRTVTKAQYAIEVAKAKGVVDKAAPLIAATETEIQYQCDHVQKKTTGNNNEAKYRAILVSSMMDTCHSLPIQSRELFAMVNLQISNASNAEIQKHQNLYDAEYYRRIAAQKQVLIISGALTERRKVKSTISIWTVLSPL
ncbi:MAG: hypothetical protein WCH42_07140 [Actinomycetes bacterium]